MAQSSFPQCRREGVQYRISTTENAQEEIWYSQKEIPIAMFTQRYQPHLGTIFRFTGTRRCSCFGSMTAHFPTASTAWSFPLTAASFFSSMIPSCIAPVRLRRKSRHYASILERTSFPLPLEPILAPPYGNPTARMNSSI